MSESRIKRLIVGLPTLGGAGLSAYALVLLSRPSVSPDILVYSYWKVGAILLVLGLLAYLLWSLRSRYLMVGNNVAICSMVAVAMAFEIGLRLFLDRIPPAGVALLPAPAREELALRRATFSESTFVGDGMLFAFRPRLRLPRHPWIAIDRFGYRNSVEVKRGERLDVVVLGDSMAIAMDAKSDLGELFRRKGLKAVNLAMPSYGPPHYRDILRKLVVERDITVSAIVVCVALVNDVVNARRYEDVVSRGGNFEMYLGKVPVYSTFESWAPWSLTLLANIPLGIKDRYFDRPEHYKRARSGNKIIIRLPYATFEERFEFIDYPYFDADSAEWGAFVTSMREIVDMARAMNARIVIAIMPVPSQTYDRFIVGEEILRREVRNRHGSFMANIDKALKGDGVTIVDLAPSLAAAAGSASVSADGRLDVHLNTFGTEIAFRELLPHVTAHLGTGETRNAVAR